MGRLPLLVAHPVVILARGRGTRLASVAHARHKTLEQIHGRTVLDWILQDLAAVRTTQLYLHLREPDPQAATIAAGHVQPVGIAVGPPTGYLPDVVDCARYGDRFSVVEADTITYPGSLRNFLVLADQFAGHVDLCMGVAPREANPNGPAVVVGSDGLVRAVRWTAGPTGLVPLGAWHWTRRILTDASAFTATTGSTSIADYITWAASQGARVAGIGIPAGFNINTPDDLRRAQAGVLSWTTQLTREDSTT